MVKSDGNVWLLLEEVEEGYKPIIFKDGKFMIKDPIYHSHPVVRVTALGAEAYAQYYGRRLPMAAEWVYAYASGAENNPTQKPVYSNTGMMHGQGQIAPAGNQSLYKGPFSVTQLPPNKYGIRGLNGNVDEWGIIASSEPKESKYGIFPGAVERQPWEAFENVGFRTVLPVSKQKLREDTSNIAPNGITQSSRIANA